MRSPAFLAAYPFFVVLALSCTSEDEDASGGAGGAAGSTTMSSTGGAAPLPGPISGTVSRYDYKFDGDLKTSESKLTIDVAAPGGDCVELESVPMPSGAVAWNDSEALTATVEKGVYKVCGAPVAPGPLTVTTPSVFAQKTLYGLDVGFSKKKNMAGGDFTYMVSWVGGCDLFGPCDNDPGTLAEMHFDIAHPAGTTVLCPGVRTEGATSTRCDITGTLAPTYSAVGWASDTMWTRTPFLTANGVDWVFYEVPGGNLAKSLDPVAMKDFFGWMVGLFGPFPYGNELRIAGGPTAWLGFEHPANIVLLEDLDLAATDYADAVSHVTMHEITHQWAGNRTTLASTADFVWKEATSEYLPYVFEDEHLPPAIGAASRAYWDDISIQSQHFPRPTDEPTPHVSTFYGDVYGPGPMTLYVQLEPLIGRPAILAGLQAFFAEPGTRSVEDLRVALESASGKNLKPYFDAWVFGTGAPEWPSFEIETTQVGDEVTVKVTQVNASAKVYPCAVEIDVAGATQTVGATVDFGLAPASPVATAKVTLAEPVLTHALDPRHRLVAREKTITPIAKPAPRKVWIF